MGYKFDPSATLYHGTIDLYGKLLKEQGIKIIKRSQSGVDFGPGFYLTAGNEQQARIWANRRAEKPHLPNEEILEMMGMTVRDFLGIKGTVQPVIVKYQIKDIDAWLHLQHEKFEAESLRWKKHVWMWREATQAPEQFDWVFGPVADGGLFTNSYHTIRAYPNMNQLSIHNQRAVDLLELLEVRSC